MYGTADTDESSHAEGLKWKRTQLATFEATALPTVSNSYHVHSVKFYTCSRAMCQLQEFLDE